MASPLHVLMHDPDDDDEVATDTEPDILESRSPHQASGSRQGRSINGHSTVPLLDFSSLGTSSSPNRHRGPLSPSSLTAIPTYRSGQRTSETHPTTAPLSSPTANGHPSARGPARAETAPELSATQKTASISPMANKQPATHGPVPPRDGPKNVHTEPASGSVQGTSRTQVATASARHTTPLRRNATEPGPASSSRHGNRARSASGPLSDDWHYRVIVHDDKCVSWLDKHHIPWGVQWQIALGISHGKWTWEDITEEKLIQLKGKTEFGAPRVRKTIKPVPEDTPKTEAAADLQIWYHCFDLFVHRKPC